jgi:hypothetical protein
VTILEAALLRARTLRDDCVILENRLLALAILAKETGLTEDETTERQALKRMHAVIIDEVIDAYADLHRIGADIFGEGARP